MSTTSAPAHSFSIELRRELLKIRQDYDPGVQVKEYATKAIQDIATFWRRPEVEIINRAGATDGFSGFDAKVTFTRNATKRGDDRVKQDEENIRRALIDLAGKIKPAWLPIDPNGEYIAPSYNEDDPFHGEYLSWKEYREYYYERNDILVGADNEQLKSHHCFNHIKGNDYNLRLILDSINVAVETHGRVCNHILLYGETSSGKTMMFRALHQYLEECIPQDRCAKMLAWLEGNATTRAGFRDAFTQRWSLNTGLPLIIGIEEAEKCHEDNLDFMLGAADSRQSITSVQAKRGGKNSFVKTPILFVATVNNINKFKSFKEGAVASRFTCQLEVARPTKSEMREILLDKLAERGWNEEYADAALEVAEALETDEPRVIEGFLTGKDRLIDGSYLQDRLASRHAKIDADHSWNFKRANDGNDFTNPIRQYEKGVGSTQSRPAVRNGAIAFPTGRE